MVLNVVENNDDNKLYATMVCCQSNALGGERVCSNQKVKNFL